MLAFLQEQGSVQLGTYGLLDGLLGYEEEKKKNHLGLHLTTVEPTKQTTLTSCKGKAPASSLV